MLKHKSQKCGLALVGAVLAIIGLTLLVPITQGTGAIKREIATENIVEFQSAQEDQARYLSDYPYIVGSKTAYGAITMDKTSSNGKLTLKYDGNAVVFEKGIWAHASSNVYYDLDAIRNGDTGYDTLMAYVGLNTTSTAGNGVIFWVYGSNVPEVANGQSLTGSQNWEVIYNAEQKVTTPGSNAELIKLDVSGYRFVRLQVADNNGNGQDHSVWADIKLVKDEYQPYLVPEVEQLDAEIREMTSTEVLNDPNYEIAVLRRDLVKNAGQYTLTTFINASEENRETMNWLYNDVDALRMYTTGGRPTGTYAQSLEVLSQLYQAYKDDFEDRTALTTTSGTRGELYEKMVMAISLTHSKQVRFWIRDKDAMAGSAESPNVSRPLDRYLVYKRMYLANKLQTNVFEQLEVEELRYLMMTELGDDEIEWLRDWLPTIKKGLYTYPPLPYVSIGNHYWYDENYPTDEIEQTKLIQTYKLMGANYDGNGDKSISGNYLIGFEAKAPHLWMIYKYGGVCWQISNFGQNMTAAYGVPSTTFGQPGHVAYANYELGSSNIPAWALTNDVSGWQATSFTGYTNINTYHEVRQLNNWGAKGGAYLNVSGNQGTYTVLAQAALNDFDNYENAEILVRLAESYTNGSTEREQIYWQALAKQAINLDVWTGLIRSYMADGGKTAEDYYNLALKMSEAMKRFPLPYYDMMRAIIGKVPASGDTVAWNSALQILLTKTLKEASAMADQAGNDQYFRQTNITRLMANYLLGTLKNEVAVFSFDGFGGEDDANTLKLGSLYEASSAAWEYSLDGGQTWYGANNQSNQDFNTDNNWITDKSIKLTDEQVGDVNIENGILVHIQGVPRSEKNNYKINITKGVLPSNLYANDLENRVVGVNTTMEWREKLGDNSYGEWVSYKESSPIRVGDVTIQVRVGATGTRLASDASVDYVFTKEQQPDNQRYIAVSHLSVASVSSQATGGGQYGNAIYAIDGNANTRWHSAWNGSDTVKELTVKFDHTVKLSALEYMPAGGGNGRILEAEFYGSEDGTNFTLIGKVASSCEGSEVPCAAVWPNVDNAELRKFEFTKMNEDGETVHVPVELNYLKIKGTRTSSMSSASFIAAKMFNFYEDRTDNPNPTAGIEYSTIEPTQDAVIARVVSPDMAIIFDDGSDGTHVFEENGEYTFRFHAADNEMLTGQAIAKVDWIITEEDLNRIRIEYSCKREALDGEIVSEEIDCSGRRKVNQSVTARVIFPAGMNVTITNNGYNNPDKDDGGYESMPDTAGGDSTEAAQRAAVDENGDTISADKDSLDPFTYLFMDNGEFTFEYVDEFGNTGEVTAKVDWIDKALPKVAIVYDVTSETEGPVIARIIKVPKETQGDGGGNELDAENAQMLVKMADDLGSGILYDEDGLQYDEEFTVVNGNGTKEHRFDDNGEYSFEYCDEAGNCGVAVARVDWIKKTERPVTPVDPVDPSEPDNPDNPGGSDNIEGTRPGDTTGDDTENSGSNSGVNRPGNSGMAGTNTGVSGTGRPATSGNGSGQVAENGAVTGATNEDGADEDANKETNGGGTDSKDQSSISSQRPGSSSVNNGSQDKDAQEPEAKAWYMNPVVWGVGGVGIVVLIGLGVMTFNNRRR